MTILLRLSLALLTLLAGCTTGDSAADWELTKDAAGHAVAPRGEQDALFGVLAALYAEPLKVKGKRTLLLPDETLPVNKRKSMIFPQDYAAIHKYVETAPKACVDSFLAANKKRSLIAAEPPPPHFVEVLPLAQLNKLFHGGGWTNVRKEHPKAFAIVSVARPGTCDQHAEALLFISETRGDGGLQAMLVHAKRDGDAWRVVKKTVIQQADAVAD